MSLPDRDEILRRFTSWLDAAFAAEEPPRGIPAEILAAADEPSGADLYSVQAALTALVQEVKLQGRAFKQLNESIAPVAELAPALDSLMEQARVDARREVLDGLLDLRDRLAHGEQAAEQAFAALEEPPRWWRPGGAERRRAKEIAGSLREGYNLTAGRLDDILSSYGVTAIDCRNRPFDPRRMQALGAVERTDVPDGSVVEVYRRGYEWNGEVYRPAQVRVARHAAVEIVKES